MPPLNRRRARRETRRSTSRPLLSEGGWNASQRPTHCLAPACEARTLPATNYCSNHQGLA